MTRRLREATLWAGAVLGLLSVVAGTAVMFFGFSFLIFRSGSMGPDIPTGSLALARTVPAAELAAGDVVSVLAANGARITHRVVGTTVRGDEASLILQGDANGTPDDEIYQVTEAQRAIVSLPYAGYVVTVLLSPAGLLASVCLSGMLMLLAFGTQPPPRAGGPTQPGGRHRAEKARGRRRPLVAAGVAVTVTVSASLAGLGVHNTSAFYTDPATIAGPDNAYSSATIATPATPTTQRQPTSVTLSWSPQTAVGSAKVTRYEVLRFATATGGTGVVVCSVNAPTTSCSDNAPTVTTSYYQLRARIGTNWLNDSARAAYTVLDATPPTITFVGPPGPADVYANRQVMSAAISQACSPQSLNDPAACGRASDPSGIARVQYQLRRVPTVGTGTECVTPSLSWSTTCSYYDAALSTETATSANWELPGKTNQAYSGNTSYRYTLLIIATDKQGNSSNPAASITFTNG